MNPAVIVLFAPVFAWIWVELAKVGREPSTAMKMVIGLALLGLGFVFMVIGGGRADNGVLVSPLWLVAAFTFHTWGELCLSPVGLSYVTKVAPVRFASLLMGVWFLANGAANKIAGTIAELTPTPGSRPRRRGWRSRNAAARGTDESRLLHDLPGHGTLGIAADDLLRPATQAPHGDGEHVSRHSGPARTGIAQ